jgi:uncharacterized membrane protein YjjP (DUF1212 family)
MKQALAQHHEPICISLDDAVHGLLSFGAAALRAGNTASRTREWMELLARKMGFDGVSVNLSLDNITAAVHRSGERAIGMRDVGPAGMNAWRIVELDRLARTAEPGLTPAQITAKLVEIGSARLLYSPVQTATTIGIASGAFAFLNGSAAPEMIAAAIGAGIGQWWRSWLLHRHLNHFAAATLTALVASGVYVLIAVFAGLLGLRIPRHPAGFISSVLFLVPGFPLIAGLFDLLHHQTVAALSRLAHGVMILLVVAFGLSIVIELTGVDLSPQPALQLPYALKLLLRAVASFAAGSAFAMLFNNSARVVLAAGFLAAVANELRLVLHDTGMMLAPAAFFGALTIGLVALMADYRFKIPAVILTVPPIIIMVPGLYAFQTLVSLIRGELLEAMQAFAACGFVIGALAMGLAAARFTLGR